MQAPPVLVDRGGCAMVISRVQIATCASLRISVRVRGFIKLLLKYSKVVIDSA